MLDQYEEQGLFGTPVPATDRDSIFNLVWTYVVKELDKQKKARAHEMVPPEAVGYVS
jgi:hypothetical protein